MNNSTLLSRILVATLIITVSLCAKSWYHFTSANSNLPRDEVISMAIQSDGTKWFISENAGLVKMVDTTMTVYTPANSDLPAYSLYDLEVDADDNLWIGTEYSGLTKYDGVNWTVYNTGNSDIVADKIRDIDFDSEGNVWIACDGGISILDSDGQFETITIDSLSASITTVSAIEIDGRDHVWAFAGDLYHYDGAEWEYIYAPSNTARDILVGSDYITWLCLYNYGAMRIDEDSLTFYNTGNSPIPHKHPYCVKSFNNEIWFGTFNGIGILQDTSWSFINPDNSPLINKVVYDMELLDDGEKWFATRGGISGYFEISVEDTSTTDTSATDTVAIKYYLDNMCIDLVETYPNPFNPQCHFHFTLPYDTHLQLKIYNSTGKEVVELASGYHSAGIYDFDLNGESLSSGIYIYRLMTSQETKSGKLVLMK